MIRRVLFTDRIAESRIVYAQFLEGCGFEVEWARNGLECLYKLLHNPPDILILDSSILWGGAEGVIACMQECLETSVIPVVLITDEDVKDRISQCTRDVAIATLSRPLGFDELLTGVQMAESRLPSFCFDQA